MVLMKLVEMVETVERPSAPLSYSTYVILKICYNKIRWGRMASTEVYVQYLKQSHQLSKTDKCSIINGNIISNVKSGVQNFVSSLTAAVQPMYLFA